MLASLASEPPPCTVSILRGRKSLLASSLWDQERAPGVMHLAFIKPTNPGESRLSRMSQAVHSFLGFKNKRTKITMFSRLS